jgi:hypothetical protein
MMVGCGDGQAIRCFINDFRAQRKVIGGRNIYVDGDTGDYVYWYIIPFGEISLLLLSYIEIHRFSIGAQDTVSPNSPILLMGN